MTPLTDDKTLVLLTLIASGAIAYVAYPVVVVVCRPFVERFKKYQKVKVEKATRELDDIFMEVKPKWLKAAYVVAPLTGGLILYAVTNQLFMAAMGLAIGGLIPDLWVRQSKAMRRRKFQDQLVDALFILSSSLRAGLSMTQAFEQLESEMTPPASQEFGLMMKAHHLGRTLEECLQRLNDRMPSDDMNLIITAVLVAKETGGDVTHIITQLVSTIRERRKLKDKVTTLTLQGRLQAYIMSLLPVLFFVFVRTVNPGYFDIMLKDSSGQMALATAVGLWLVGMFLLFKMSKVEI